MGLGLMGIKQEQDAISEQIERVKTKRLTVKLRTEEQGLKTDEVNLQKAKVGTDIASEGLKQETIKLATIQIGTASLMVAQQSSQQKLNTDKANLRLQIYNDQADLQLKSFDLGSKLLEIKKRKTLIGDPPPLQLS